MELTDEEKQRIANGESLWSVLADRVQRNQENRGYAYSTPTQGDKAAIAKAIADNGGLPNVEERQIDPIAVEAATKAAAEMEGYTSDGKKWTDLMQGYHPNSLDSKNEYSEPEVDTVNESTDEKESIWSKIAKMLPSIKMGQNSGTTMAGWTRYNGGSSPIAAAYNNWLANRQNAQNSLRTTLINAETQKELAAKNAESTNKSISDQTDKENKIKLQNSFTQDVTPVVAEMRQNERTLKSKEAEAQSLINPETGNVDETNKIAYKKLQDEIGVLKGWLNDDAAELSDLEESYGLNLTTGQSALKGRYITKEDKTENKPVENNVTPTVESVSETDGKTDNSSLQLLQGFKYTAGKDIKMNLMLILQQKRKILML